MAPLSAALQLVHPQAARRSPAIRSQAHSIQRGAPAGGTVELGELNPVSGDTILSYPNRYRSPHHPTTVGVVH